LCDQCGICCLQKIEDENSGEVKVIGLSCEFLDTEQCRCLVYADRKLLNPDCILLTPQSIKQKKWLPDTCAYRRLAEGKKLEQWHPLISKDPKTVHHAGISIRDKVVSGIYVHPKDIEESLKELKKDELK
jgi:uncharacterized cysteine cluster protein YcgN (CxxCxxCC family)